MEKKKAPPVVADINVTPMVDVMLVLLIIFMVITPMLQHGASVDLAKTHNPIAMQAADKEDAVLIAVTRDGKIFLSPGNSQTKAEELPGKVKDLLTNKLDKTVYIKSDARARYERVTDVIDNLRAAGVDQIGLLTEQVRQNERIPRASGAAGQ
jgi:biopolymer transport protein ExbD/biopolymer transport protein TolR